MKKNVLAVKPVRQELNDYEVSFNAYSPVRSMCVRSKDVKGVYDYLETIFTPAFLSKSLTSIELQLPF